MGRSPKRMFAFAASLAVATGLSPVSAHAADDIIFGFATAQSGAMSAYDGDGVKMAQLFMERTNAAGGLLGRQIKAVFADTKSDRVEGAKAGQEVVREGAAVVFDTCDYDYGAPAGLQAQKAGVISVSICAGDPKMGVLGVGKLAFTSSIAAQVEGAAMADWGYTKKGYRSAYVLLDDTIEYDKSVCAGFDWYFPIKGGKIVEHDTFHNDDPSIASQVTRITNAIRDQKVDAVMLCTYMPGGASAVRQLRAAGITLPILNGSSMDGTYWLNAVPNLSGFYEPVQATVFGDPRPDVVALYDAFKAKFGAPPATQYAFPIYAWLQMWARAVTETKSTDAKTVVAAMEKMKDVPTVLGPRSYTPKLHIQDQSELVIAEIDNGQGRVIEVWPSPPPIPPQVLYRTKK